MHEIRTQLRGRRLEVSANAYAYLKEVDDVIDFWFDASVSPVKMLLSLILA